MHIGLLQIELYLPGNQSLKGKRQIIKSIKDRVRNQTNVSISEVDFHDAWQKAQLAVVTVSTDHSQVSQVLASVIKLIENTPGSEIINRQIEML
jgi:uncharacterized protein YlxP (DUF503 family)